MVDLWPTLLKNTMTSQDLLGRTPDFCIVQETGSFNFRPGRCSTGREGSLTNGIQDFLILQLDCHL